MSKTYTVSIKRLTDLVRSIFEKNGMAPEDAGILAQSLVDADSRGMRSHGVIRVENYVKRLVLGSAKKDSQVTVISETPFSAVLDGNDGLGAIISTRAADLCRSKAEACGFGAVVVKNSNHNGAAAFYCERMAKDDMIAFSCSNVEPLMAPPGAMQAVIGNNPFCVAAPAGDGTYVVSDMATSQVALGKVINARVNGQKLPGPWGIDENGAASDDPNRIKTLAPMGLHKGYGIAVMLEILTSVLAGGAYGTSINSMYGNVDKPNKLSHFFMAFKISAFRELQDYYRDINGLKDYLHGIPTANGQPLIVPGDLEISSQQNSRANGIELADNLAEELIRMAYGEPDRPLSDYLKEECI